jgi:hypothetical protein
MRVRVLMQIQRFARATVVSLRIPERDYLWEGDAVEKLGCGSGIHRGQGEIVFQIEDRLAIVILRR